MKIVLGCLLLAVAAQAAVSWSNVKPKILTVPRVGGHSGSGRIIGGNQAYPHQFPYQAGLFMDGVSFCGGTLISDTVVLTAAHCAEFTSQFEIHLGAQNIYANNENGHQVIYSQTYTVHAMWDSVNINNDIAFVRLQYPVSGVGVAPIRLPSRSQANLTFAGAPATVSGWGAVSDINTGLSDELKYANVTVITNTECFNVYGSTINDNKICIDTAGGTASTCFGDSGGPLAYFESDGLPTQIGITSFVAGDGCQAGYPAGFTRVTYYLDWLEFNTGIPIMP